VSRNGTLLPIPEADAGRFQRIIEGWPNGARWTWRADWLRDFEQLLGENYPQSSSADRRLTARHHAPFPLRDGHDVP
jgi:hypothetical protein